MLFLKNVGETEEMFKVFSTPLGIHFCSKIVETLMNSIPENQSWFVYSESAHSCHSGNSVSCKTKKNFVCSSSYV
jgi:hypothetical protein